jgi:hypothetical protein
MPRRCAVEGCEGRATIMEAWQTRIIEPLIVVWFCAPHHDEMVEGSTAVTVKQCAQFDGSPAS